MVEQTNGRVHQERQEARWSCGGGTGLRRFCLHFQCLQRIPGPPFAAQAIHFLCGVVLLQALAETFTTFGVVTAVRQSGEPGPQPRRAWVEFQNDSEAHAALALDQQQLWGQQVSFATAETT